MNFLWSLNFFLPPFRPEHKTTLPSFLSLPKQICYRTLLYHPFLLISTYLLFHGHNTSSRFNYLLQSPTTFFNLCNQNRRIIIMFPCTDLISYGRSLFLSRSRGHLRQCSSTLPLHPVSVFLASVMKVAHADFICDDVL